MYAYAPFLVPEEQRQAVAELICRINRSVLRMGAIDLCMDTGSLRFRHGLLLEAVDVTVQMIENIVREGLAALDHVLPMVQQLLDGASSLDSTKYADSTAVRLQ